MSAVFEGVKVADFTWVAVGPLTTRYLADFGATVVRIESSSRPDAWRTSAPFKNGEVGINRSGYYGYHNANKYSIAIDLNNPKGREIAKKLVSWADIVAENFTPGQMERWGLGYEDLKKIKPDIIMLRSSNQGSTGPLAKQPGYGHHLVALGGFCYYSGWPDREPLALSTAYTDCITPRFAAAALITALIYRRKTGKGQLIDISQLETAIHFLSPLILDYTVNGQVGGRTGNYCANAAPHGVYRCKGDDRWCAIAVFSDNEWKAFCNVIGNPGWTKDPKFTTLLARKKNEEELNELIEEWTNNLAAEEVMTLMQQAGVAAGVVKNAEDVYQDSQLRKRDAFWLLNHSEIGYVTHLGQPFKLSKTPAEARMPAPCLGEHTEYVCKEFLGMSDEEFVELLVADAFE
jgi:crotonobetainyl-CoA:carnitine CoA-transferase CaiB-like acyl-CoA transferase